MVKQHVTDSETSFNVGWAFLRQKTFQHSSLDVNHISHQMMGLARYDHWSNTS